MKTPSKDQEELRTIQDLSIYLQGILDESAVPTRTFIKVIKAAEQVVDHQKAFLIADFEKAIGEDESLRGLESPTWNMTGAKNELRAEMRTKLEQLKGSDHG